MKAPKIPAPSQIRKYFALRARTAIGQHFLSNGEILGRIADCAGIGPRTVLLEIGMGPGYLTGQLLAREPRRVVALEMDERFEGLTAPIFAPFENLQVVYGDALKQDWAELLAPWLGGGAAGENEGEGEGKDDLVVIGNIPYQITSPLLFKLWESGLRYRRAVLLVQKEFAERMASDPGRKQYGVMTLKAAYFGETRIRFAVGPKRFDPPPRVESSVIEHIRHPEDRYDSERRARYFKFINGCFSQKRKTLVNSLIGSPPFPIEKPLLLDALDRVGVMPESRAEMLPIETFYELFETIEAAG